MRATLWLLALGLTLQGCAGPPDAPHHQAPFDPVAQSLDDPVAFARQLVAWARDGRPVARQHLAAHVDWPWVTRLAPACGAFIPTLDDLVRTLAAPLPDGCAPTWRLDEGGHRLDFPPAMIDDPDDVAAELDALKAEHYTGYDAIVACAPDDERLAVQLARDAE